MLCTPNLPTSAAPTNCQPCWLPVPHELPQPPLSYFSEGWERELIDFDVFPISSEIQIGKIQHLIQRVPCGLYLTVGGERGFRAASMSDKITALYMLDVHEDIIRYNRINRELLKAPSRQHYLHLRWDASFTEWQTLFEDIRKTYRHTINVTHDDFDWWSKNIRDLNREGYVLPETLNKKGSFHCAKDTKASSKEKNLDLGKILDYKSGNYLFYDDLYERIHTLAINNRIFTSQINLLDDNQVTQLIDFIKNAGLTLSVLDLDNLYFEDYLTQEPYHKLISQLTPLGQKDSVLLVMSNYKDYACGQFQIYMGFTFENITSWQQSFRMQDFIDSIPKPVHDLINGKLYEGDEELPVFE